MDKNLPHGFAATKALLQSGKEAAAATAMRRVVKIPESKNTREQFVRRQTAFAELTQHALAGTDLDSLMGKTVSLVAEALGVEYCKVLELELGGEKLLLRAGVGWKEGYVGHATVDTNSGSQAGYTLVSHEPVIVEDITTETRFSAPPLLREHHVVSGLSVIIGEAQRPYGILGAHTAEPRSFTGGDVNFLQSIANVLAAAIQRKRAEESLDQSRSRLAGIIESALDAIITLDAKQRIVIFNRSAEQMFRCSAAEVFGQPLDRFIPARYRETRGGYIRSFGQTGVTTSAMAAADPIHALRSDGEEFPIEASISQSGMRDQKVYTVIIRDITQRRRAEERIREQTAFLDSAQDAIIVRNLENRIIYWNRGAERLYGWTSEEVLGKDIRQLHHRVEPQQLDQATESVVIHGEWKSETKQVNKQGKELIIESRMTLIRDDSGKPKSILTINTDVTDKKNIEAQFLRAQRMENIGLLAGGVAHDLNNLLTPITMGVSLIGPHVSSEEDQHVLSVIKGNAKRGAELIKQILSFSRGDGENRIVLQPRHLISELVATLRETFPKNIKVQFEAPANLSPVGANATQLYQVFLNLSVNARDALPDGGLLKISAQNVEFDENCAVINSEAQPGHYVLIIVEDTGVGIEPDVLDKIFDPFFTTKEEGKGTGLGLSTSLAIVKSHEGFMEVSSTLGRGSQFKVYLPAVASPDPAPLAQPVLELSRGNGETVLVVDDETRIREITTRALTASGYKALSAKDGTEALATYVAHKEQIKAVVMDLMMPHMNGLQTIRALKKLNPRLKVVTTSGGPFDEARQMESARLDVNAFLPKPFDAESLLEKLSEVLRD